MTTDTGFGVEMDVLANLGIHLGSVAHELEQQRRLREKVAAELWYTGAPDISFTGAQAPYFATGWGPNTGFFWAVQRVSVYGLGSSDVLQLFKGNSGADVAGQNFRQQWNGANGVGQTWHPGGKGWLLMPDQSVVLSGTLTAATSYFMSVDVIQGTLDMLGYYVS